MVGAVGPPARKGLDFFRRWIISRFYTIVLLLSPPDQPQQHLAAMNVVFSNLQKGTCFRKFLRQSATKEGSDCRSARRGRSGKIAGRVPTVCRESSKCRWPQKTSSSATNSDCMPGRRCKFVDLANQFSSQGDGS